MGITEDLIEEWKKLPPAGKVAAGGAGIVVVGLILLRARAAAAANQQASQTLGSAATDPTSGAGIGTVQPGGDIASPVIEQELQQILQQLQAQTVAASNGVTGNTAPVASPTTPAPATTPSTPTMLTVPNSTPTPAPVPAPAPSKQYVTVARWLPMNTPWNSYLSGIASHEGESLTALESLNPQITNPNLIRQGQQVRVR